MSCSAAITNISILVRITCLRNLCPKPISKWAFLTRPGRSAIDIWRKSGYFIIPILGIKVVNGTLAISGLALVNAFKRVDLPN